MPELAERVAEFPQVVGARALAAIMRTEIAEGDAREVVPETAEALLDGLYLRRMAVREPALVVGRPQLKHHMLRCLTGCFFMLHNGVVHFLKEGDAMLCERGAKVAYFPGPAVLETIHPTEARDLSEVEAELVTEG